MSPLAPPKGPILVVCADRRRATRLRQLLQQERFEASFAAQGAAALDLSARLSPTVVLLDWSLGDADLGPEELVYRLRPRRIGPRVVAIAPIGELDRLDGLSGLRGAVSDRLDAEELIDAVWRCHHEVVEAREDPPGKAGG